MNNKLILIDGSSLLSTSFFGNVPKDYYHTGDTTNIMKTSDGKFTNGVFTMAKVLLNIIEKQKPTHMAIAWDISRNTFRREMYTEYKGHRKETKPELSSQFGLMQELLDEMNIVQFKLENYEADDIIGTFAKKFENDIPVYIITKDQDALQLITDKTFVWLNSVKAKELYEKRGLDMRAAHAPDGYFEFTPQTFEEEYGLKPIQIIDMKAIEGDSSDNIPGVKGVGATSVVPLLQKFGTVEGIYEAIENTPEEEFKNILKNELGISRSPVPNLTKKTNEELASQARQLLGGIVDKKVAKEVIKILKTTDNKEFKESVKVLDEKDLENFKSDAFRLISELENIETGLVGKKAAFLSKKLATIKIDMEHYSNLKLDELELNVDREKTKFAFERLEFNSLIDRL